MKYEYLIELKWSGVKDDGTEDTINFNNENISSLMLTNDYEQSNMPMLAVTLTADKNDMDKIITNVKTACFYVSIYKLFINEVTNLELKQLTPYYGKATYFVDQDINYNKEIDYSDNKEKKDNFIDFTIGMMFSECIDANKQTINTTLVNSTRFNSVCYFLSRYPYCISPFTYNDTISQLIVPPMDSLSKTIKFFNDIKVFYDTPYRFYIEPGCMYLLDSSGNGVQKQGEDYDTCMFNIRSLDSTAALAEGMESNDDIGCYYADVNVKDSYYTIDSDTEKLYTEIQAIIDPSIEQSVTLLSSVNEAINTVNKMKDSINDTLKKANNTIKSIPSALTDYKCAIDSGTEIINSILTLPDDVKNNKYDIINSLGQIYDGKTEYDSNDNFNKYGAIDLIKRSITYIKELERLEVTITTSSSESGGSTTRTERYLTNSQIERCEEWVKTLNTYIANINADISIVNLLPEKYQGIANNLIGIASNVSRISSFINSVSPINISDNVSSMLNKINSLKTQSATHTTSINTELIERVNSCFKIENYINASKSIIKDASDLWDGYIALQNSDTGGNKAKPNPFKSDRSISNLSTATTMIDDSATRILDAVNRFKSANLSINNAIEQVSPQIKDLKEFKNDIKTTITGTWDKLRDISKTAKESLQNIVKSANQLADKVKSLSFSINDLQDLQKNINMVKDISNIGMLGISNFAVDLNLKDSDKKDNNTSDSANIGTKLIRLSNDNANMIKNIKADLENHVNQLSISKTSLDTTIITPNKRYIVKNYDAHSNNDGVFLLTRKIDYFIKAGDRFTLSTKLDLIKVGESGSVTEKEKQLKDILNNSQNILNTVKSGNLSIGSIGTIMDNAKSIEKSYNKLRK